MLKRVGILALMVFAFGAAVVPQAAFAQDGYYGRHNDYYYQNDRDWERRQGHEWRERERRERRAEEWRERAWRQHEWREHEWRERRDYRYDRAYPPGAYFGFGYRP